MRDWFQTRAKHLSELFPLGIQEDPTNIIGMSITSSYIKLMKIQSSNNHCLIDYFDMIKLPQGLVVKNEIKDYLAIGKILKEVVDAANLKTKYAAITIPRSSAIVKNITVDNRLNADE